MHLRLEGLVQNSVARVVLNVLPARIAMSEMDSQSRKKTNVSTEPHKVLQIKNRRQVCAESVVLYRSPQFVNISPATAAPAGLK